MLLAILAKKNRALLEGGIFSKTSFQPQNQAFGRFSWSNVEVALMANIISCFKLA